MLRYFLNLPLIFYWIIYSLLIWFLIIPFSFFDRSFIKGGDIDSLHLPAIAYLSENLHNLKFPFWTEKLYSGFPIYAVGEMGFLSPLRVLLTLLIADFLLAIKLEFLIIYLIGSIYLYILLKKDYSYSFIQSVLSHIIIFFGVPVIVRLLHLNIIYTYYLLPVGLYFLSCYLSTLKFRFIFLRALVFALAFSYGNYHAIFICLIIEFLFLFYSNESSNSKRLKYLLNTALFSLILILPMLVPSLMAFRDSARSENLNFLEGSYSAVSFLNIFNPLLEGAPYNYIGNKINSSWYAHETLTYLGISSLIISILVFLNRNFKKYKLVLISLYIFVFLSTLDYSPIGFLFNFPPINLFRYWGRSSLILLFAVGLIVPKFFDKSFKFDFEWRRLLYVLPLILYIVIIYFSSDNLSHVTYISTIIKTSIKELNLLFLIWFSIFVVFIVFLFLYLKFKKIVYYYILCSLVIFDTFLFSKIILNNNVADYTFFYNQRISLITENFQGKRVVYFDKSVMGNKPLLYSPWGVHGYLSSYEELVYKDFYKEKGLGIRRIKNIDELNSNLDFFKSVGVSSFITEDGVTQLGDFDSVFLIDSQDVSYMLKDEGHILARIYSDVDREVDTTVKVNKNFIFKLNGEYITPSTNFSSPFYSLNLYKGLNEIEVKFFPKDFYISLVSGGLLLGILLFFKRNDF